MSKGHGGYESICICRLVASSDFEMSAKVSAFLAKSLHDLYIWLPFVYVDLLKKI